MELFEKVTKKTIIYKSENKFYFSIPFLQELN